jgi:hypothetical protein
MVELVYSDDSGEILGTRDVVWILRVAEPRIDVLVANVLRARGARIRSHLVRGKD